MADEGGIPGRIPTEENAARCVSGRREASRDFSSRALGRCRGEVLSVLAVDDEGGCSASVQLADPKLDLR
jgi:hypothetical protein